MLRSVWPALLLGLLASHRPASACTTFLMTVGGKHYLGKSYDWDDSRGHVIYNKRGVGKRALLIDPSEKAAHWVSKHASLTFNQYGREMPNGGMNDAGLVVEIMWLQESIYPPPDQRPTVTELQWIQYQLDSFSTVGKVVQHLGEVRLRSMYGKVHYLACDRRGACVAVELLSGKLVATHGKSLVVPTLTNDTYAASIATLKRYAGFGGVAPIPSGLGSLERFVRTSHLARQRTAGDPIQRGFAILDSVRSPKSTQWQIVYDLQRLRVTWRSIVSRELRSASLGDAGAGCETPVTWVDVNSPRVSAASFKRWTATDNQALLAKTMRTIGSHLPAGAVDKLSSYPEHLPCTTLPARGPGD
jgi:penicillin V acylase-like amidase (Ntn superfamily)